MPTLTVTSGAAKGTSLDIDREIVIGREGADLTIEDSELSRRHAAVRPAGSAVEVEDLGSLNGTFVDGRRIEGAVTISGAARLMLGDTELSVAGAAPASDGSAPEVRAARPVPAKPPPAPPPPAPDAQEASDEAPRPAGGRPGGAPPAAALVGGLLAVAASLVAVLLLGGGDEAKRRPLNADMKNTFLEFKDGTEVTTGVIAGSPLGSGSTRISNKYPGALDDALPGPTRVTTDILLLFDEGTVRGKGSFTLATAEGKDARIEGRIRFVGGTGEFDGARGSATIVGSQDGDANPPRSAAVLKGNIEY